MNDYLKLVNFEVKRFWKFLLLLAAIVVIAQMVGAVVTSLQYMGNANEIMQREQMNASEYVREYGHYSLQYFIFSEYFILSILFAAAVLIIYVFFIWYRDWLGKSSFIYRLLMLPTARLTIYFAKLTAILLFVLFFVGIEVVLLEIAERISHLNIPEQLRVDDSLSQLYTRGLLDYLYPNSLLYFVLTYGLGITVVAVVFTAILFERSYHLKGVILAVFYSAISLGIILVPVILQSITHYFYNHELILMTVTSSIIALGIAIYTAHYLLNRKINV